MAFSAASFRFPWFRPGTWFLPDSEKERAPAARPKIGLALSCGGARGLAHVGVIQILEEARVPIAAIMGSSMGAYVGSLWAAGIDGRGLEKLAAEIKDRRTLLKLLDPVIPPSTGIVHGNKIRAHLERTLHNRRLDQLQPDTFVVATNLDTLTGEILPADTHVAAAIHASSAIPGICAPVQLNGKRYIDGGSSQPLPVNLLRRTKQLDCIIGVNVMPTHTDVASCRLSSFPAPPQPSRHFVGRLWSAITRPLNLFAYGNVLDTFKRCLTSAELRLITEESAAADVCIHPYFCESKWYDFENFQRYIEAGRRAAEAALPQIESLLKRPLPTSPGHEISPTPPVMGLGHA